MTKKLLAISLALMLLVPMAFAKIEKSKTVSTGNSVQVLMPGSGQQVPANVFKSIMSAREGDGEFTRVKTLNNAATPAAGSTRDDLLWTLKHVDDNAEYYLGSGAAEDTFAVVFTPAAPAVVTQVYQQWYTAGNVNAFGADYSAAAAALSPNGRSDAIAAGDFDGTPIGEIRTTITPNTIDAYTADWSYQLDIGGTFVVGDSTDLSNVPPFVIAWVKGGEDPKPLANSTADVGGVSYTWFGGPWTVNDAGVNEWRRYSSQIDLSMLVKVTYPWGAPIAVNTLEQHNNTYDTDGPFTILADLFDDVQDGTAIGAGDNIVFHWTVGGVETTGSLTADEVGADGNGWYTYDISGTFEPGDVIEYWVTATDNDGLASESIHLDFMITEPGNPDADLLIVYDGSDESQLANTFYENVADNLGIVYEYWNVTDQKGIDASVVNAGWSNIVVYGWGTTVVPAIAGEEVNGFDTFLDNGGSLILADQDWYFGHGLPAEITFAAGDFAYDYFGIGSGTNDPADADGVCTSDTTYYGYGVTAMDSEFSANPMLINHTIYGTLNWADPVVPASADVIFAGGDGLSYGVAYDNGTFKTAYFGFMPDAAVDTLADGTLTSDQFDTFFEGALSWMGVSSPAAITHVEGPTGTVLAGPYDVSATIEDADGDAVTANILFSADGSEWTQIAMTADGSLFSGQIPDVSEAGTYYWGIEATSDGDVSMYPPANQEAMMFERFVPEYPALVVFNGLPTSGYPADYYFGYADMDYDVWGKELSAELASAYTTIIEIATDGPAFDNSAVITAWLTEGEKNYMLAGDEWFGALSNWTDMDFAAGSFEYDVLGVSHSYNDINASSSGATAIEAVDGSIVSGALYTAHMAASDTLMYDPYYEIGVSNWLDGFVPVDAASVNMTTFGDSPVAIGLNRVVNDDKVVFFGFDPLSINATPYTWWGYSAEAPQVAAVTAFFGVTSVDDLASLPTEFSLAQNYPNPFNPSTTISFEVPTSSDVVISVYNMLGQKVVDLVNNSYAPGVYNVQWNGVNADGKPVGSGLYIYQMNAGKYSATSKMLYLK
ncbi:MAG: T9SS type A sorting domain-containing protein [Candidatus Marinimicrobia bacterium]|nr:T9SS type A sorting domain-containing protein [Candidatus Neomarinimicrobiota bacterium]MCF7922963.1 T9SS type A sorting domain-containing protein [Candidatus Neomarinimicrobiota bacterium]